MEQAVPCKINYKTKEFYITIPSMAASKKHGGPREGGGRPRLKAGEESVPMMIRLTMSQKEKLLRLGGAPWVRERIEKAKEPVPKE